MTKREQKKLDLLRARAEGASYREVAEQFGYQSHGMARQAVHLAKKYVRARYPSLMPLELKDAL